ncbi:hypothetical protein [Gluconobacter kondonii]|uniref:hypothetical protein n=1 Tax=Gluconobacter kondonii TaxID=941463 RepID=UPI001B8AF2DB|nr:hypothetical protein [Gluconobacter kondonii]MBS1053724.1 hypothetical protein [Gluconobacter kondonii]MBS1058112.1 hypothetical protein [Gluconobacter kondonii]
MSSTSHISDREVTEIAAKIAAAGEASYPPGTFGEAFGSTALVLAGEGYADRLAPALKAHGFEIALSPFPSGAGCRVQKTRS